MYQYSKVTDAPNPDALTGMEAIKNQVCEQARHPRLFLARMLLLIQIAFLAGFATVHLLVGQNHPLFWADLAGLAAVAGQYWLLRRTQKTRLVGHLNSLSALLFFPVFAQFNQNADFGLVWLYFAPFMLVALNGWRVGLVYLGVLFTLLFAQAFNGIGVWQGGDWSLVSALRFSAALLMGTLLAVLVDEAHSRLYRAFERQNVKERRYINQLQHFSNTDSLTSLYNRHYLNRVVEAKIRELTGSPLYITFFILDIDQFKLYNDHFGHPEGDQVLRRVAQTVKHYIRRRDDLVFRLGGEEFGGILISDHPHETSRWIAQLTQQVEALQIPHAPKAMHAYVTVSIGIFSAQMHSVNTFESLYAMADEALYEAKQSGRNRAVIHYPEEQATTV